MRLSYYSVLGVPEFCDDKDKIRKAYLAQIKFFHPDAANVAPEIALEKTRVLNDAYEILRDENKKRAYDLSLGRAYEKPKEEAPPPPPPKQEPKTSEPQKKNKKPIKRASKAEVAAMRLVTALPAVWLSLVAFPRLESFLLGDGVPLYIVGLLMLFPLAMVFRNKLNKICKEEEEQKKRSAEQARKNVVYISKSGDVYHRKGCPLLRADDTYAVYLKDVPNRKPCPHCHKTRK